jgi:hypothetical protein
MTLFPTRHARFSELVFPGIGPSPTAPDEDLDFDEDDFFDCVGGNSDNSPATPTVVDAPVPVNDPLPGLPSPVFQTPPSSPPPAVASAPPRHEIIGNVCPANIIAGPCRPCAYVMSVNNTVPNHYHQAISGPDSAGWKGAILKELDALDRLGVWDIVKLSPLIKTLGATWVFRVKHSLPNGDPEFKAHLCAQGFSQTHGVNYSKTFAPTGRLNSLRALISHAAIHNLEFGQ